MYLPEFIAYLPNCVYYVYQVYSVFKVYRLHLGEVAIFGGV